MTPRYAYRIMSPMGAAVTSADSAAERYLELARIKVDLEDALALQRPDMRARLVVVPGRRGYAVASLTSAGMRRHYARPLTLTR